MSYYSEEPNIVKSNYEVGFTDSFDKFPIWLRWLIFIPASIILYLITYHLTYFSCYYTLGYNIYDTFIGQSYRDILFVLVPTVTVHECVPRFTFIIGIIFSSVYIVLGIISFTLAWLSRPYEMNLDYFFSAILPCFITVAVAITLIVYITKHKLSIK